VEGIRGALARFLFLALIPYAAAHLAGRAASAGDPAGALAGILAAAGQDPPHPGIAHPEAGALLALLALAALDTLAYLALAAAAFLLCAAAARASFPRAAFPHPRITRALVAATGPFSAWRDACEVAADRVAGASTPRDALLALALGACVAHSVVYLAATAVPLPPHHGLPFRALDAHAFLAAVGAMLFLMTMVGRVAAPACGRLWRRL